MLKKILVGTVASLSMFGAANATSLESMSWEDIVKQAKEEGEVTWFQWYFEDRFRETVKGFETEYGIKVTLPDLDGGDTALNKVIAEKDREAGDIDVVSIPGSRADKIALADYFAGPIMPMLPESANVTDQAEGGDWKGYAIKFWGNQTGMAYNSARTNFEDLPQSLADLETWMEANPGQLGFNFENGGSGLSFIQNIARNVVGDGDGSDLTPVFDWFKKYEDQYVLTTSNNDSYARINDGEFTLIAAWEDGVAGLIKAGEMNKDIKVYLPEWGMNGGGNVVAIPHNAPNPAAALLFVLWLTSAETQTGLNANFGSAPANSGSDDTYALISNAQRANSTDWGAPLPHTEVVPAVIENVFQN